MAKTKTKRDGEWLVKAVIRITRFTPRSKGRGPMPVVELAYRLGVNPATIYRWLDGSSEPSNDTVARVAGKVRRLLR